MRGADPFQSIMDIAHEVIQNPMYFGQSNMQIFAITRNYSSEDVFAEWDEIKSINSIPLSLVERMKKYNIPSVYSDDLKQAVIPADKYNLTNKYCYSIRTNCYVNNKIWGHLYIYIKDEQVKEHILQIAEHIVSVYSSFLCSINQHTIENDSRFTFFIDLLDGKFVENSLVDHGYSLLGWTKNEELIIHKIVLLPQTFDVALFNWVYKSVAERLRNSVALIYQKSIVLISNITRTPKQSIEAVINNILSLGSVKCGASLVFGSIKRVQSYYEQATYAAEVEVSGSESIQYFEDYAYACMSFAFREHLNWSDWIHPAIYTLMEMDSSKGTEYFKTLQCFLMNGCNYKLTADILFIHRNTLKYRMENIKDILTLNLDDERTLSYLRLCYEIMESIGLSAQS